MSEQPENLSERLNGYKKDCPFKEGELVRHRASKEKAVIISIGNSLMKEISGSIRIYDHTVNVSFGSGDDRKCGDFLFESIDHTETVLPKDHESRRRDKKKQKKD